MLKSCFFQSKVTFRVEAGGAGVLGVDVFCPNSYVEVLTLVPQKEAIFRGRVFTKLKVT